MINLRAYVDKILRDWGHNILLQRRIVDHGEGVYDLRSNSGFDTKIEEHKVRDRLPRSTGGLAGSVQEMPEGLVADVDKIYYFRWDVNPSDGDRIYDKDPTATHVYLIDWALPIRGWKGRIEYWVVGATQTLNKES